MDIDKMDAPIHNKEKIQLKIENDSLREVITSLDDDGNVYQVHYSSFVPGHKLFHA